MGYDANSTAAWTFQSKVKKKERDYKFPDRLNVVEESNLILLT